MRIRNSLERLLDNAAERPWGAVVFVLGAFAIALSLLAIQVYVIITVVKWAL